MVHFEDKGHVSKGALDDFGGFRKVPSQNIKVVRVIHTILPFTDLA